MLGFPEGSRLARELEQGLDARHDLPPEDPRSLAANALLLRRELDDRPEAMPSPAETPVGASAPVLTAADPQPVEISGAGETRLVAVDDDPLVLEAWRRSSGPGAST